MVLVQLPPPRASSSSSPPSRVRRRLRRALRHGPRPRDEPGDELTRRVQIFRERSPVHGTSLFSESRVGDSSRVPGLQIFRGT